jgi:hypothetical protein
VTYFLISTYDAERLHDPIVEPGAQTVIMVFVTLTTT